MKIELESQDIQLIAEKVAETLRPLLANKGKDHDDEILDVPALCKYLSVTAKWIRERTHLKEIPYYKLSNKQLRFRRRDIDKWLDSTKTPAISEYRGRLRVIQK